MNPLSKKAILFSDLRLIFFLSTVILKIALFGHDINEKRNQKAMILEVQTNKYTREIPSRISWPIYERLYHY